MSKCLMVLESPWNDVEGDPRRMSVLPFFEGMIKCVNRTSLYYSNFYNRASFVMALRDISSGNFSRQYLYVAAHGTQQRIGNMNSNTVVNSIRDAARIHNIEGVILGSCNFGNDVDRLSEMLVGSNLRWVLGYRSSVNWLESTLFDLFFMKNMMAAKKDVFSDREKMTDVIWQSFFLFNPAYPFASKNKGETTSLLDSVSIVIQPEGQGAKPISLGEKIWANYIEHLTELSRPIIEDEVARSLTNLR